jgi:hypothetical protein
MSGIMLACVAATGGSGSSPSIALDANTYIEDVQPAPGSAQAQFSLTNAGLTTQLISTGSFNGNPWCVPGAASSNYEVYATLLGGALTSGTTGSWLSLGTTRTWDVSLTYAGSDIDIEIAVLNLEIRAIGTTEILASGGVNLTAFVGTPP